MRTRVLDVSNEEPAGIRVALSRLDRSCDRGALVLIGHGSDDDFMGLTADEIVRLRLRIRVLWFYACNCGRGMIRRFAGSGIATGGHCCYVLRYQNYDLALDALKARLEESDSTIECGQLMSDIRAAWFDTATQCIARKDVLFGAITNHTRLSMRFST